MIGGLKFLEAALGEIAGGDFAHVIYERLGLHKWSDRDISSPGQPLTGTVKFEVALNPEVCLESQIAKATQMPNCIHCSNLLPAKMQYCASCGKPVGERDPRATTYYDRQL